MSRKPSDKEATANTNQDAAVKRVPFVPKDVTQLWGCAPACLAMAARYFGRNVTPERVCELAGSGPLGYTLPWELALAARRLDLGVTFVSKAPFGLNPFSIANVAQRRGTSAEAVAAHVTNLVQQCGERGVRLERWTPARDGESLKRLARDRDVIVIPTLFWEVGLVPDLHNVVLTGYRNGSFCYSDPNETARTNLTMAEEEFLRLWNHDDTDNDLFIVTGGGHSATHGEGG